MKSNFILLSIIFYLISHISISALQVTNKSKKSKKFNFVTCNVKLNEFGTTTLHAAVYYGGNTAFVRSLLKAQSTDVNIEDVYGNTPLHNAISWNANLNIIHQLLMAGACINIKNKAGYNCIDLARISSRKDIIELIQKWPKIVLKKIRQTTDPYLIPVITNIIGEYLNCILTKDKFIL